MVGLDGFEWDDAKRRLNVAKHGIDFDEAIEVFMDLTCFADRIAEEKSAGSRLERLSDEL